MSTLPDEKKDPDGTASRASENPHVSIVIPVYNEEKILRSSIRDLRRDVARLPWTHEILLAENGSTDRTLAIAEELARDHDDVFVCSTPEPNYGRALREGILHARGEIVVCDEIDLCDKRFHDLAPRLLVPGGFELVVGSKAMRGARDRRPLFRRLATRVINAILRWTLGFRGTDTHGMKAFVRRALLPVAEECVMDRDLFASEFVIRAERAGKNLLEIPVDVVEKRPPSIRLASRVPHVLAGITRLIYVIRFQGAAARRRPLPRRAASTHHPE